MHLKISIDERVLMDDDIGQWTPEPPRGVQELVSKAGSGDEPWYPAILAAMQRAILRQQDTVVVVTTRGDGWAMDVTNGPHH